MPLSPEAEAMLSEFAEVSGEFTLMGLAMNATTGEIATFSSHQFAPGQVLGFLQRGVQEMVTAAANNELEYIGGEDAEMASKGSTGGKIGLVH